MFFFVGPGQLAVLTLAVTAIGAAVGFLLFGPVLTVMLVVAGMAFHAARALLPRPPCQLSQRQLVDALVGIASAFRAGMTLYQAMEEVARTANVPLSQEFALTVREVRMGTSQEDALENLAARVESEDLALVVSAINTAKTVGGDMAEMLDRLSDTIRERFRMEGRIRSLTAQGKLQGYVIGSMPLVVWIAFDAIRPDLDPADDAPLVRLLHGGPGRRHGGVGRLPHPARDRGARMTTLIGIALMTLLVLAAVFLAVHSISARVVTDLAPPELRAKVRKTQELAKRPFFWLALAKRIEPYVPQKLGRTTTRFIVMAGGLEGLTPAELTLYSLTGLMVGVTAGLLLIATTTWTPWLVLAFCLVGALLPVIWLRDQVKKRHDQLIRDLPFHLDLLTLSVEAGLDFAAAVGAWWRRVGPGRWQEELMSFLGEIRMGKTRAESLQSMSDRVGLPALSNFLAALVQADRLGSGLGRALRLQSEQLRSERFQRAEKAAGEAPVKMLIPLVLFIFPTDLDHPRGAAGLRVDLQGRDVTLARAREQS